LFPALNLLEHFFLNVNRAEVTCSVTMPQASKLHVFYDPGTGWNPANRVITEVEEEKTQTTIDFAPIRTQTLRGLRLYFRTLDTLESYHTPIVLNSFTVISAHDTIRLKLDTANVRMTCMKRQSYDEHNGLVLEVTCEDSYLEFKQDLSSLRVATYNSLDRVLIGVFLLLYLCGKGYVPSPPKFLYA